MGRGLRFVTAVVFIAFSGSASGADEKGDLFARGSPRIYTGDRLQAVAMPIGGIGTGTIWLNGEGRLSVWQIFDVLREVGVPDSFFTVRARAEGGEPVLRALQTVEVPGFPAMKSLAYRGDYPIAWIDFDEPALPVEVGLEALNPMIPLDVKDSAIPCAIIRLTAKNKSTRPVEVSFAGMIQNPVGYDGQSPIEGRRFGGYGGNRNTYSPGPTWGELHLSIPSRDGSAFGKPARLLLSGVRERIPYCDNLTVIAGIPRGGIPPNDGIWVEELDAGSDGRLFYGIAEIAESGGAVLATDVQPGFLELIAAMRKELAGEKPAVPPPVVFEDFEKGSYEGWTVTGEAFGKAPHTGTTPGQQHVSGFRGKGLVNTFLPNDGPHGTLTSRPFRIERRYIGFLVGGGSHRGETCINLVVDGKVARTRAGKNNELLEAASWDVRDLIGKEARIEIVDRHSGGWGHINIDHIIFSDAPPDIHFELRGAMESIARALPLDIDTVSEADAPAEEITAQEGGVKVAWRVDRRLRIEPALPREFKVLVRDGDGRPLMVECPLGKGRITLCLAGGLPRTWALARVAAMLGTTFKQGDGLSPKAPSFGDMCLLVAGNTPTACARWDDAEALAGDLAGDGRFEGPADSGTSPAGETFNGALAVPFTLRGGESRTVTFVITWYFPNADSGRFGHEGNMYANWFADARGVSRYVRENLDRLLELTHRYHDSIYESNLPYWFIDAITSQTVIFRGPTCFWTKGGYFAGFEGCYYCCPLNCTHVWNYAQSHARLFPSIGRNMRESDLLRFMHPTGEISHRQHAPHNSFIDGQAATIEAAYREHLGSPDKGFLDRVWPSAKKAMDWMIQRIDSDEDGVPRGRQPNTYDCDVSGANTFIGSQYLSALGAAERMAVIQGDEEAARRYRRIRAAGSKNMDSTLWNGEYYIQVPDRTPAHDYNTGCHSDQLLGQWWAHQLNLGYLFPPERVGKVLESIVRYNVRKEFSGFVQRPRRYVIDSEGGLLMCTWPKGGRPNPFIVYADEVWTGIEYSTAGLLIFEGMLEPAFRIVKTARDRYDGRLREGLNSGPGGNPFNELECGKFYARAMSSWGLLLACQGLILDGPKGVLGFDPTYRPGDHVSFFVAAEGWGVFRQTRADRSQSEVIEVRHGKLRLRELVFALPRDGEGVKARIRVNGKTVPAEARPERLARGRPGVRLVFTQDLNVSEGTKIEAALSW